MQGKQGAKQHRDGGDQEHHVIAQDQGLTRYPLETHPAGYRRRAQGIQGQGPPHHQRQEHQDKQAPGGIGGKRVDRGQHAGAHHEGAQQAQGKGEDGQQYCPAFEQAAFFRRRQRVDQGGAGEPGHEGGVFHRIPEPPATPAQFVIGPPAAEHDPEAQEGPGDVGPGSRPARPGSVQAAAQQGGDGEGKGHREAHIAHIQQRRVNDQARVLQQRVEVVAVGGRARQQPGEGIRGEQQEGQETNTHRAHHRQYPRQHQQWQLAAENRDRRGPETEDQCPQQQGALMVAPYRGEFVDRRQQAVAV